jgi:hypothetical protein
MEPMKELWTALVELLTPPSYSDSGDTRCFTNVVAWAESPQEYTATVSALFEKSDCVVLSVEQCVRVSDCDDIPEDLLRQVERAKTHPKDCIFGTLHYYPSPPT